MNGPTPVDCGIVVGVMASEVLAGDAANNSQEFWKMAEGTIKRVTEKGFGFIDNGGEKDLFFHSSSLQGVRFDDLREGQKVTYDEASGPKGPCAENVQLAE